MVGGVSGACERHRLLEQTGMAKKRAPAGATARVTPHPVGAVEASILRGMEQAIAFTRGDRRGTRVTTVALTGRAATARRDNWHDTKPRILR
jgi:hypothetical protein